MSSLTDLKALVEKRIDECYDTIRRMYPNHTFVRCNVEWRDMGRFAGKAFQRTNTIALSPTLLLKNGIEFIKDTPGHEVAHLFDAVIHPETRHSRVVMTYRGPRRTKRQIHGPTWQHIMRLLKQEPSRCHQFDTTEVRRKTPRRRYYVYACTHGREFPLSVQAHRKIATGTGLYWCQCATLDPRRSLSRVLSFVRQQIGKQLEKAA